MSLVFALSPLLAVALGAILLMLAEAFGTPASAEGITPEGIVTDAGAGRGPELALVSAVILAAGAVLSVGVWMVGPATGDPAIEPYLILDRFTFFQLRVVHRRLAGRAASGWLPARTQDRSR